MYRSGDCSLYLHRDILLNTPGTYRIEIKPWFVGERAFISDEQLQTRLPRGSITTTRALTFLRALPYTFSAVGGFLKRILFIYQPLNSILTANHVAVLIQL